ncbi:hypothetical protein CNMCM5623_007004 [Aspergillus felis]|uniref:Reverse transcriptase n=1 Tax=Aspergillus felis TaxID=1287682 RepID=A0A8H6QKT4_9EURO|nr:hypothetical protein CNMCM5623_007004 [Aspergillus felis]
MFSRVSRNKGMYGYAVTTMRRSIHQPERDVAHVLGVIPDHVLEVVPAREVDPAQAQRLVLVHVTEPFCDPVHPHVRDRAWEQGQVHGRKGSIHVSIFKKPPSHSDAADSQACEGSGGAVAERSRPRDRHPWLRPSPHSRPGFTPECRSLLRDKKRLRRTISAYRSKHRCEAPLPLRVRLAQATQACKRVVQRCRRNAFRQQITDIADMDDVWRAVRWTKNRGPYQAYTPPLRDPRTGSVAYGAEEKADLLARQFFPSPPPANLDDLRGYDYPEPISVPEFREHEVLSTLRSVKPDKAPGPDGITNRVLQAVSHVLVPGLTSLYNQCIRLGYCPEHFRDAATVALRKPGKPDYSVPKAYRPIALLNTLSKLLEALVASRMSYLAETHGLLPENHFGGRKGQGTENALHAALEAIHSGWKNGKVVSALLLDISGAFDNVSHDRLLHNLRASRIPQAYVTWLSSFLRGRSTSLLLPEYTMPTRRVETGIPQGSPLSPILYIFYNAGLMGRGDPEWGTDNIGYIDDTTMLATGDSEHANCQRLRAHYRRGCLHWAATHASQFELSKFQLIHFHPPGRRARGDAEPPHSGPGEPLDLGDGQVVQASATARLLGVTLDQHLTFEAHLKHVDTAATRRLQAISALGGSKWGLRLRELRHIYTACITPIMLYAASVWYAPPARGRRRFHSQQVKVLNRIQRRAGKLIAGAFRTVSGAAFDAELHLTPMPLLLRQRRIQTLIRIATTPAYRMHILDRRRRHHRNMLLQSPLEAAEEEVELATGVDPREMEIRLPWAVPPWWEPPEVVIEETKERSMIHHDIHCIAYPEAIRVYTDGSGIRGKVGTAAVCLDPPICRQRYLGTDVEHTVPVAEIAGLVLALRLLKRDLVPRDAWRSPPDRGSRSRAEIYSDNQGALRTLLAPKQAPGQYLVRELVSLIDRLDPVLDISFHWLAAHRGVAGNELADRKAKEAAGWRPGNGRGGLAPVMMPDYPTRGPLDAWIRQHTKEQWEEAWRQSEHGRHLRDLLPDVTKRSISLYDDLTPVERSVVAQMRTGKIGLNHYLTTINRAEDPLCPCGRAPETTHHVLFGCTRYDDLRRTIWTEGTPRNLTEALTEKRYVRRAARFMLDTGRLTYLAEATQPAWLGPSAPSSARPLTALAGDG